MNNIVIRKVKVLQGIAKDLAEADGLEPNDLVILTVSLEKVIGSPVDYLLKQIEEDGEKTPRIKKIELILDGLMTDGAHHKQWYLEQLLLLSLHPEDFVELKEHHQWEEGIAP